MKKIIYAIFITLVSFSAIRAQDSSYAKDIISFKDITINNLPVLQMDTVSLIQHYGQPNSINPYFNEMENINGEYYNYNGVKFYLEKNMVMNFIVTGKQYSITPYNIKVGDNINLLESYFPLSFKNMKSDANGYYVGINIKETDRYLFIQAGSNSVITKISVNSY